MKRKILSSLLLFTICLTGCANTQSPSPAEGNSTQVEEVVQEEETNVSDNKEEKEEETKKKEKVELSVNDVTFVEYNKDTETDTFSTIFDITEKEGFKRMKANVSYLPSFEKENLYVQSSMDTVLTNGGRVIKYSLSNDDAKYEFTLRFEADALTDKSKLLNDDYIQKVKEDALKTINKKYNKNPENVDLKSGKVFNDESFTQYVFINGNAATIKYNAKKEKYDISETIVDKENKLSFDLDVKEIPAELFEDVLKLVQNVEIENVELFDDFSNGIKLSADNDLTINVTYDGEMNVTSGSKNADTGINFVQFGNTTTTIENNNEYRNVFAITIPHDDAYSWITTEKFESLLDIARGDGKDVIVEEKDGGKIAYNYRNDQILYLVPTPHAYTNSDANRNNILVVISAPYNGDMTKGEQEELKEFASKVHISIN